MASRAEGVLRISARGSGVGAIEAVAAGTGGEADAGGGVVGGWVKAMRPAPRTAGVIGRFRWS